MLLQEAFQILELEEGAGRAEIRHAYAKRSKLYHVETQPEEFSRLHEAYKLALSAAKRTDAQTAQEEDLEASEHFTSPAKENIGVGSAREDAPTSKNSSDDILDRLLGTGFSIQSCSELTQLLYYRCRYDEISPEIGAALLRITNMERGITDDEIMRTSYEATAALSDQKRFLGIPWGSWKILNWTCIVCHPNFYRAQYTPAFLGELCQFLLEETLNLRDGIQQELYFALCMAYGFFSNKKEAMQEPAKGLALAVTEKLLEIEKLLRLHPKHKEYIKDLEIWPDCQEAHHIVLFCQEVYQMPTPQNHPVPTPGENTELFGAFLENPSGFADPEAASRICETAAELLLDGETPWKVFIYDCLVDVLDAQLFGLFSKKREEFQQLYQLRRDFSCDFIHLLDNNVEENYIYNACYLPLSVRLDRIKMRYLTKKEWKKIICRPAFLQSFQNWLFPRHNGFSSVPCVMHYDTWKMLRTCFEGDSPFEKNSTQYLTTEFYFPEYEKRYQRERIWEDAHIEEAYFRETFPIPALSQGKLDLLRTINDAAEAGIEEVQKIFGNLTFDSAGLDFLTRITNAMTHFNFLLVTQKHEKEAIPGDAFCFLEDEVLLYRKKEHLLCRLTHPVFYDLISWKFEAAAYHTINKRPGYDEAFLNTACKNLYYYRCYTHKKRNDSSLTKLSE